MEQVRTQYTVLGIMLISWLCNLLPFIDLDQRLSKVGMKGMDIKWGSK